MIINSKSLHLFWYFVWERQNVYWNRFVMGQPAPWTENRILREYKFTNVYRELDRTTIWYHNNIGGNYYLTGVRNKFPNEFVAEDVIFATFIHRLFNRIETMEAIKPYISIGSFDKKKMIAVLEDLRSSGENIFTSAHLTTGVRFGGYDDKLYNIVHLIDLIHKEIKSISRKIKSSESLEDLYLASREVNGFGPFLGYQYALDIINSGIKTFSHDDFTVAGPGCKRGIKHVFPNAGNDISFESALILMRNRQYQYFDKFGFDFKFVPELGGRDRGIHLGNIENCFCEFSKYYKAHNGYGRPRNRFVETEKDKQLTLIDVEM